MGAKARMYLNSGYICRQSGIFYNNQPLATFGALISPGCGSGLNYYSYGAVYAWNGNAYDAYLTFKSPSQLS